MYYSIYGYKMLNTVGQILIFISMKISNFREIDIVEKGFFFFFCN